jgi:hypothetical protein
MKRFHMLLAAAVMLGALSSAQAQAGAWQEAACAAWDLHIVGLIEQAGTVEPAAVRLVEAAQHLQQARLACRDGDADRALRLYESIDLQPPSGAVQVVFGLF